MHVLKDPLTRYRVMAWIVGVGLIVLVFIGVPLQLWADTPQVAAVVGTGHGFLYIVYLLAAFDLAVRRRWSIGKSILVLGAGTVPFLSFVVERWVTRTDREQHAAGPVPAES